MSEKTQTLQLKKDSESKKANQGSKDGQALIDIDFNKNKSESIDCFILYRD